MKNLPRIMERVMETPWAITNEKKSQIDELLRDHISGAHSARVAVSDEDYYGAAEDEDDDFYQLCGAVAVVDISGIIGKRLSSLEIFCGGCDVDQIKHALSMAYADERVEAIVLDIDSPGGMVVGTPELANFIAGLSEGKLILSYSEMMMCSAAYWIGCAAGEVFCSESALVGSIGVVCSAIDQSEKWKAEGKEQLVFRSAPLKAAGMTGEKWSDEWKENMQAAVAGHAEKFYAHVRNQRGGDLDDECFSGAYWSGEVLLELGLVDGFVDTLDEFVQIVNLRLEQGEF